MCNPIIGKREAFLRINLKRNSSNSINIFLLDMNFEKLIIEMHVLITLSILAKFRKD